VLGKSVLIFGGRDYWIVSHHHVLSINARLFKVYWMDWT